VDEWEDQEGGHSCHSMIDEGGLNLEMKVEKEERRYI
jgi:hypothetical protein